MKIDDGHFYCLRYILCVYTRDQYLESNPGPSEIPLFGWSNVALRGASQHIPLPHCSYRRGGAVRSTNRQLRKPILIIVSAYRKVAVTGLVQLMYFSHLSRDRLLLLAVEWQQKNRYDLGATNLYRTECKWNAIKFSASIWMLTAACGKSWNVTLKPDKVVRLCSCNDLHWLRLFQRRKHIFSQSRSPYIFEVCTWWVSSLKFVRGMNIVPGPRRDILWRWASCTGWTSVREVSLLLRVQVVYRMVSRARQPNLWQRKSNSVLYRRPHFWGQNTLWHEICKPAII